ncbi:Arylsulfatase [Stieleria magnilauensis]|uniref:Arylsulfatase n=2 Tax=Stieleria magnilauensis TaxID=2527963 RepID=A0ABX5XZA7_9BACT|nr:Arylsulfatase [Planctomycetes bacterium TBK1r]
MNRMIKPLLTLACVVGLASTCRAADKPNVLFIAIDDLRPELGCYGSEIAVSPNLDALANDGLLFNRAYCQQAICRPSRASLMTGARPETTGLFHNYVSLRELQPDIVTLPQHFIAHGYETAYCGKIFHQGDTDEENSWSRSPVKWIKGIEKPVGGYALPENNKIKSDNMKEMLAKYGEAARRGLGSGPAYENADVPDTAYGDGYNTRLAIETMKQMAKADKPFFLGLGFKKPHLNWTAPKRYWDLYDPDKIPMAAHSDAPEGGAAMGLHASFELRTRAGIPKIGPLGPELSRTLKHAYLACVSYVDAQVGLMVRALEDAGVRDNTIIIVWGDHGWHLGDLGVWGKATNYEIATRVPLMIWTPGMKSRGKPTDALVELVDMYPTLCELAGLPIPDHVEGHSFVPLLDDPDRAWKKAAFSQYPNPALREWAANPLSQGMRETWFGPLIREVESRIIEQMGDTWDRELFEQHLMGYTMRTDRYRLVVWRDHRNPQADPVFVELFDHQSDPGETKNVALDNPNVVARLTQQLDAGWKAAL